MIYLIPLLFGVSFGGLAYVLANAMVSGAEVYSGTYSQSTAKQFEDIFLFIPPRRIAEIGWSVALTLFLLVFLLVCSFSNLTNLLVSLAMAVVAGILGLYSPRRVLTILRGRRLRRFNVQLVDTLVSMSNSLKAGFSLAQAFESVAKTGDNPIAQEFDVFLQQTRLGVSFSDALSNMEERVRSDDLTLVITAIETARRTGGNLTEVFEKIASTIRERMRIENRIRTLTAQGRLQGTIVGLMPIVIIVALSIVDPGLMNPFLHSAAGAVVLIAVACLIACGAFFIRKIVRIDV